VGAATGTGVRRGPPVVVQVSRCRSCGQEADLSPLPTSELLSILGEALGAGGDQVAVLDVIGGRARSSTARLQVAVWAVWVLGPRVRDVAGVLAEEQQVAALEELFGSPTVEEPDR
jgi:hypothetical protein